MIINYIVLSLALLYVLLNLSQFYSNAEILVTIQGNKDLETGEERHTFVGLERLGNRIVTAEEANLEQRRILFLGDSILQVLNELDHVLFEKPFRVLFHVASNGISVRESSSTLEPIPNIKGAKKMRIINRDTGAIDDEVEYDVDHLPNAIETSKRYLTQDDYESIDEVSDHRRALYQYDPNVDKNKFHLLILGSAYENAKHFLDRAQIIKDKLMKTEPFSFHSEDIIVHFYNRPDINFQCKLESFLNTGISCDSPSVIRASLLFEYQTKNPDVKYEDDNFIDEVLVLHNDGSWFLNRFCGQAIPDLNQAYKISKMDSRRSYGAGCGQKDLDEDIANDFIHELGHSFGGLCDE